VPLSITTKGTYLTLKLTPFLISVFIATSAFCGSSRGPHPITPNQTSSNVRTTETPTRTLPVSTSPIRAVDFSNFTFPARPVYTKSAKPFTLKNGQYGGRILEAGFEAEPVSLVDEVFGDVTGDGIEEALVVLTVSIRGSAIPYYVYLYSWDGMKPKLVWSFETGDRGDSGLRRVFSESGGLALELYGKNKFIGGNLYGGEGPACCPDSFTRSYYEWTGAVFRRADKFHVLPNPDGSAPYLRSADQKN